MCNIEESICESTECRQFADELVHRSMNISMNPCDDFYEYVCGNWAKYHQLTGHETRLNSFAIRNELVQHEINDALKNAANSKSHSVQFLSQLYQECNNTQTLESRGVKPLHDLLDSVLGGWPLLKSQTQNGNGWKHLFTQLYTRTAISPVFRLTVQFDRHLNQKYLFIGPGGTGIAPGNLLNTELYQKVIEAYKQYIKESALLLGATDGAKLNSDIENIIHLETRIAKVSYYRYDHHK